MIGLPPSVHLHQPLCLRLLLRHQCPTMKGYHLQRSQLDLGPVPALLLPHLLLLVPHLRLHFQIVSLQQQARAALHQVIRLPEREICELR